MSVAPRFERLSVFSLLGLFTHPRAVLQTHLASVSTHFCLSVSGLAYCLFYLQTGLDLVRSGSHGTLFALLLAGLGLVVGTAGVGLLAALAWVMARPWGNEISLGWVVRAFGLGYIPALLYAILGILANLALGWNTSLAFGVTGVLWALGPILTAIREMTGQHTGAAIIITTVCGALMLAVWGLIVK